MRLIDLALKDLLQIVRDWRAAFFLLIMPVAFTLMFGFAFGGFESGETADPRLPVGLLDQDHGALSDQLLTLLQGSQVIRIERVDGDPADLESQVVDGELAAVVIVPQGYGQQMLAGQVTPLTVITDPGANAAFTAQGEIQAAASRLSSAVSSAQISVRTYDEQVGFSGPAARQAHFDDDLAQAVAAWENPPITSVATRTGAVTVDESGDAIGGGENAFAQSSPGMMAQFAIAGLMGASTILVLERKNRALQRLLTTNITRMEILLGHYLAMFVMIFVQLAILVLFGQMFLRLDYLSEPAATTLLTVVTALFAASLGLLIGIAAKNEEQVIVFALIPMFVLSGLGGAWVPMEVTPEGFQQFARLTPVAWVMEGYQDIILRGLGLAEVILSVVVLLAYTVALLLLAAWLFYRTE